MERLSLSVKSSEDSDEHMRHADRLLLQDIARNYPLYAAVQSVVIPTTTACNTKTEAELGTQFNIIAKTKRLRAASQKLLRSDVYYPFFLETLIDILAAKFAAVWKISSEEEINIAHETTRPDLDRDFDDLPRTLLVNSVAQSKVAILRRRPHADASAHQELYMHHAEYEDDNRTQQARDEDDWFYQYPADVALSMVPVVAANHSMLVIETLFNAKRSYTDKGHDALIHKHSAIKRLAEEIIPTFISRERAAQNH
ncbi:hypothetical protein A3C37_05255 [Candidatus Peribacteria bacterium RIFCSPHIGHO2_02_FULL_53_20]|nr:MAG: hypothetical protein A3C37_05255 [Candidatus Peribacteria bacterium RIFCSPHIGHO2_02_FULL_53_20]OGJ70769.1 MAG: hypothetical protein A3G69_00780 [Candidatus Peribacteria bacterium RIFCSPLOWO2_12_FULL_53_10]